MWVLFGHSYRCRQLMSCCAEEGLQGLEHLPILFPRAPYYKHTLFSTPKLVLRIKSFMLVLLNAGSRNQTVIVQKPWYQSVKSPVVVELLSSLGLRVRNPNLNPKPKSP